VPKPSEAYELPFLAPVPHGHEVVLVALLRSAESTKKTFLALDRTASILYCDDELWGIFRHEHEVADPVAALTRWSWVVAKSTTGRVVGAMVSTADTGDSNHAKTRLFIEPIVPGAPYR
jgi:hypothetical protein